MKQKDMVREAIKAEKLTLAQIVEKTGLKKTHVPVYLSKLRAEGMVTEGTRGSYIYSIPGTNVPNPGTT